jgi:hypothetical protein
MLNAARTTEPTDAEAAARRRSQIHRLKAEDAADVAARAVPCSCEWAFTRPLSLTGIAVHADDCARGRAWALAFKQRMDELEAEL